MVVNEEGHKMTTFEYDVINLGGDDIVYPRGTISKAGQLMGQGRDGVKVQTLKSLKSKTKAGEIQK